MLRLICLVAAFTLAAGCRTGTSTRPATALQPPARVARYDPAHDLGPLFQDVQLSGIFADSKTFVDARPLLAPPEIAALYASARSSASFSLQAFVERHFELPRPAGEGFSTDTSQSMEEHIRALWPVLTRSPDTAEARRTAVSCDYATARCSTATGTTGPSPGLRRTARITSWLRRSPQHDARRSIATSRPRPKAAGTSRAAGCVTRGICGHWKRPTWCRWTSTACSITPSG